VQVLRQRWMQILLVGLVLFTATDMTLRFTGDPIYIPTLMMLESFLVPVVFVAYFYRQEDLLERKANGVNILPSLLSCALFGGLIGTIAAGLLEYTTLSGNSPFSAIWVGPIEESAKMIVPVAIFILERRRFRSELDGLLFGVASGMSFAALETMGYGLVALAASQGDLTTLRETILVRGLLSPAGHAAWTGLIAATLWRERERTGSPFTWVAVAFFVLAAALHSLWDYASSASSVVVVVVSYVLIGGTSLSLLVWRFRQARRLAAAARAVPPFSAP